MIEEIWKDLEEYPNYEFSSWGRVRWKPKIISGHKNNSGYISVNLNGINGKKTELVHRLIARAFFENPENKRCVNHKNGIRDENGAHNLEWVTHSENLIHAIHVLKTHNPPENKWSGKTGKFHNRSIGFCVRMPNGEELCFGSALEFERETGVDQSCISWARKKKLPYTFKLGKAAGITVLRETKKNNL